MFSLFITFLLLFTAVRALPNLVQRQAFTSLSKAQIDFYDTYSYFAAAAQCDSSLIEDWSCDQCSHLPGFNVTASGGNGGTMQFWFVGYYAALNTVIVGHQGTDTSSLDALLTDADISFGNLDPEIFPGISKEVMVHNGFLNSHARVALSIVSAAQTALSTFGTNSVTCIGFSLGAALALLDSVVLSLNLPQGTVFKSVLYGLPRVGNQAFANYIDSNVPAIHINHGKDPVPIVPGKMLGYVHPSGEIHITKSKAWVECPGQDNPDNQCVVGTVPNVLPFFSKTSDHRGPYNGIYLTCDGKK